MDKIDIVAIDPSFRNMGMVKATYDGLIEVTDYRLEHTERASEGTRSADDWQVALKLSRALQAYTEDADVVIMEQPVGSQSARSAWTLGITLGVLTSIQCPVITLTPRQVKYAFTGDRKADKGKMIETAIRKFPAVRLPHYGKKGKERINMGQAEHIADALGVLYTGVKTRDFKNFAGG
jgi:Holliday junction resolvasome RuvABC endonuclease subunit